MILYIAQVGTRLISLVEPLRQLSQCPLRVSQRPKGNIVRDVVRVLKTVSRDRDHVRMLFGLVRKRLRGMNQTINRRRNVAETSISQEEHATLADGFQ